jgi:hypothetical protein
MKEAFLVVVDSIHEWHINNHENGVVWDPSAFNRPTILQAYSWYGQNHSHEKLKLLVSVVTWLWHARDCQGPILAGIDYVDRNLHSLTPLSIFEATEACFLRCMDHKGKPQDIHSIWFPYTVAIMAYALWMHHEETCTQPSSYEAPRSHGPIVVVRRRGPRNPRSGYRLTSQE